MSTAAPEDLLAHIDSGQVTCLNEATGKEIRYALFQPERDNLELFLESDCDEELLITILFTSTVKLVSITMEGPEEGGPEDIKLFVNQRHMSFDDAEDMKPQQSLTLKSDGVGVLDFFRFQRVESISLFVHSNRGSEETTKITKIALYGFATERTDLSNLKACKR